MSKIVATILFILLLPALTFYLGTHYEKKYGATSQPPTTQSTNPPSIANSYDYRCGDGSEFTIVASVDKEYLHVIPASNIEIIPNALVSSLPAGSRERYEGGGVSIFVRGKALLVTVGERPDVLTCQPMGNRWLTQ